MPARASRQPIYISITTKNDILNRLSGKYDFRALKNCAAAFVREGGKLKSIENGHLYYLMYNNSWLITKSESFEKNEREGWLLLKSQGLSEY